MFYKSIASVYDYIFPQNKKQLEFIESISPIKDTENILDIGCATGNLTELLYSKTKNVIGLDLDEELLSIARKKHVNIDFRNMNMLDICEHFQDNSIAKVISFGNTLVHLPNRNNVKEYFKSVYSILNAGGTFIVQIINYDRIINKGIDHLPTIDNDHIKFIRDYEIHDNYVDFNTELLIKANDQVIKNSIPLLALTKKELTDILKDIGFRDIKFYGSLNSDELSINSVPLLFSCSK